MKSTFVIALLAVLLLGPAPGAQAQGAPPTPPGVVDRLSLELAREHRLHGRLADAEAQLAPLTGRNALGWEGRELLGEIAAERGDWQQAEAHYRAALAQAPDRAGLHLRLGQVLQAQHRRDAEVSFDRYRALRAPGAGR